VDSGNSSYTIGTGMESVEEEEKEEKVRKKEFALCFSPSLSVIVYHFLSLHDALQLILTLTLSPRLLKHSLRLVSGKYLKHGGGIPFIYPLTLTLMALSTGEVILSLSLFLCLSLSYISPSNFSFFLSVPNPNPHRSLYY
jgi:hypothetical protein